MAAKNNRAFLDPVLDAGIGFEFRTRVTSSLDRRWLAQAHGPEGGVLEGEADTPREALRACLKQVLEQLPKAEKGA